MKTERCSLIMEIKTGVQKTAVNYTDHGNFSQEDTERQFNNKLLSLFQKNNESVKFSGAMN